jgi:hypothetical protein
MIANRREAPALLTRAGRRPGRILACLLLLSAIPNAMAGLSRGAERSANGKDGRWAILIAGISGDQELQREFIDEVKCLHALLSANMHYPAGHIEVLVDDPSLVPGLAARKSTAENLVDACRRIGRGATRDDSVFVFIAGHGNYDGKTYKLNLVGPDPTADDLASDLYAIPARSFIVVNTTTCSGGSIGPLAQPGRVVVTATRSGHEKNRTVFGRYFVEAFKNNSADTDKDGRVSVLEAFKYASQKVEEYYTGEGLMQTEHPALNDSSDGLLARTAYLDTGGSLTGERALSSEERSLKEESDDLERQIESLKQAKAGMPADEYDKKLEALLLRLAEVSARLHQKSANDPED